MPELNFIMNSADELEFIRMVLREEGCLIPDVLYPGPNYLDVVNEKDYLMYRRQTVKFFVVSARFQKTSLCMRFIEKDGTRQYFIMQRQGGPGIDFSQTNSALVDGRKLLRVGNLAHYASYWLEEYRSGDALIKASPALKAYYHSLVRHIKQGAKLVKGPSGKHRFYLCRHAREEVERGEADLGLW